MNMLRFLQIGDQILSINDVQLDGMSHDEVVQLLKKPGTIKLTVSHGKESVTNCWLNIDHYRHFTQSTLCWRQFLT